jgi:hypothetical protein
MYPAVPAALAVAPFQAVHVSVSVAAIVITPPEVDKVTLFPALNFKVEELSLTTLVSVDPSVNFTGLQELLSVDQYGFLLVVSYFKTAPLVVAATKKVVVLAAV